MEKNMFGNDISEMKDGPGMAYDPGAPKPVMGFMGQGAAGMSMSDFMNMQAGIVPSSDSQDEEK